MVNGRSPSVALAILFGLFAAVDASAAQAGPPYVTDDPVPTDYRNWEIYTGFTFENEGGGTVAATAPFAEFNYGALPNVQVSVTLPFEGDLAPGVRRYGYGTTDFGIKARFVQESEDRPQISFYPSIAIPPAGGHVVTLLPLWLQKSSGRWTAFGGGGVYLNSAPGQRDFTFLGGALERTISPGTTIGAEMYHQSASAFGTPGMTAANIGVIAQLGDLHAILFSFGRALENNNTFSGYASYEFALGPRAAKRPRANEGDP
jgi:hypothetical protein